MSECALCNNEIYPWESKITYEGDECHFDCAMDDMDSIGMDAEFGDN